MKEVEKYEKKRFTECFYKSNGNRAECNVIIAAGGSCSGGFA